MVNQITNGDLKYASWTGSSWKIQTVDSTGYVGWSTSLKIDSNDNVHISYLDGTNKCLKYAQWTDLAWNIQIVDSVGNANFFQSWLNSTSFALDLNCYPHISYFDAANSNLKYAYWNGSSWITQIIDSAYNVGWCSSLALDPNGIGHISYYDGAKGDLRYIAFYTPTSFPTSTPTPTPSPTPTPTSPPILPTATPTPTQSPKPTSTPTATPTPSPTPAPTPSSTIVSATIDNGATVDLAISGNITVSQMANVTIVKNQSAGSTMVSFTLIGDSGTTGFGNVTIPKSAVSYGVTPVIYVDGHPASNQGYTQDSDNYYVWYTAHFSSHQISIIFAMSSSPSPTASNSGSQGQMSLLEVVFGLVAAAAIVAVVVIMLQVTTKNRRAKKRQSKLL
jgi:hypothetical protein